MSFLEMFILVFVFGSLSLIVLNLYLQDRYQQSLKEYIDEKLGITD
jgi:hypothetical protein